jgi:serine/threonine protein kinase
MVVANEDCDYEDMTIGHYKIIQELGDGNYGTAYLAQDLNNNGEKVCVKVFKTEDETISGYKKEVEVGILGIKHSNVCSLIECGKGPFMDDGEQISDDKLFIVSEACPNGEAFDYVSAADGLDPKYARRVFGQLLDGMEFIHSKGIAHRDMKLENVFLARDV